ncbi:hypothetical protein AURDEDRAFT_159804 [Auricularia subglabra TFB-10046 SS5]|nr:hypothetical protein AURDEDRAFT_159804 [Auricularia subglabra TFB-10046 SS5]
MSTARFRLDTQNYYTTLAQLENLRRERIVADEALARAQKAVYLLAAQQRQLEIQLGAYGEFIHVARAMRIQELLTTFPEDLLRCIFEAVADLPDDSWQKFGYGRHNHERTNAPFVLAAVCSRWRRVALSCPRLWTYLSLPDPDSVEALDLHIVRFELLLLRSFPCSFDILVPQSWECCSSDLHGDFRRCVSTLARHSARWHRVELWLPSGFGRPLDVLRGPLPLLSQLAITDYSTITPDNDDGPPDDYLPYAPHVKVLDLSLDIRISQLCHPGFPSLQSLTLWHRVPMECMLRLLLMCQGTLEHLEVASNSQPLSVSAVPLAFPSLRSLALHDVPFFADWPQIVLPNVTSLALDESAADTETLPLVIQMSHSVASLTLCGGLPLPVVPDIVQHLANVSHVEFAKIVPCDGDFDVPDRFLALLAESVPYIWPKLTSLRFGPGVGLSHGRGRGLLRFIKKRNSPPHSAVDEPPSRILHVAFVDAAPAWLVEEVERLLAL